MIAKEKMIVVDVDGTLCPIKNTNESYADLPVEPQMLERLRTLREEGWRILLQSSRGMQTYEGNIGEIYKNVFPVLVAWLEQNFVPFDEITLGKPWAGRDGFYVDDRAVRPREFIEHDFASLKGLCARDRLIK